MRLDIKKAFYLPFSDNSWPQKLLIGGIFYFIANALQASVRLSNHLTNMGHFKFESDAALISFIGFIIFMILVYTASFIISAFPMGYILQSMHNEIKNESPLIPTWESNYKTYAKNGLFYYLVSILYGIIVGLISAVPITIGLILFNIYRDNPAMSALGISLMFAVAIPLFLFYAFLSPFIKAAYTENFCFKDAFKLDRIFSAIIRVLPEYFMSIGLSILLMFSVISVSFLLVCTCIGILFIPFLTLPMSLISVNLFAQCYKISQEGLKID